MTILRRSDSAEIEPGPRPKTGTSRAPLPRVMYATDLDPSQKFSSMEEHIYLLAAAFRSEGGLLLPLFAKAFNVENERRYADARLTAAALDLTRFSFKRLHRLMRILRRERIACIHWNFFPPLRNPYVWWLSLLMPSLRHVLTEHTSPPLNPGKIDGPLKTAYKRLLLRRYSRIWCGTDFIRHYLHHYRGWNRVQRNCYFINTDRFRPDPLQRQAVRSQMGAGDNFVALLVAYQISAKGVDVALQAMAQLPESVHLWLAGDGPKRAKLQELTRDLGLTQRVHFLGTLAQIEPYMQAADCLLSPSRWAEAAGLVNIEAQGCGLPVIATRVGGIPELVADGVTGFLFPVDDHQQLAAHISRLRHDPSLHQQMRQQARRRCVEIYSHHTCVADFVDLYRAIPCRAAVHSPA